MIKKYSLITGLLAFLAIVQIAQADDYCTPDEQVSTYESIYCDLAHESEEIEEDLVETLEEQLGYSEEDTGIIQLILKEKGEISCAKISAYVEDKGLDYDKDVPQEIKKICKDMANNYSVLKEWEEAVRKIDYAYQSEKTLYQMKKRMEYEFRASEQYWDGQIRPIAGDAPFDLIVDLNLIDMILFGSRAKWVNDVFTFPSDDDSKGGGGDGSTPDLSAGGEDESGEEASDYQKQHADEGMEAKDEDEEAEEVQCVPIGPGSNYNNPNCGNKIVESEFSEECDDGNTESGDGCSQYCTKEEGINAAEPEPGEEGEENENPEEENGENAVCTDENAITFREYTPEESAETESESGSSSENTSSDINASPTPKAGQCPPGTAPAGISDVISPDALDPNIYPKQSENYPGPFIGGTLKQFYPSNRPACPTGQSELDIKRLDVGDKVMTSMLKKPVCIPTEFCADFDAARNWLFGENWEKDEAKAEIAASIESLFCVTLTTANRPTSPYSMNDGCIDCHITAMVDSLDEALGTNVAPLKNTTTSFGISSRWGPKFSFNLTVAVKSKLRVMMRDKKTTKEKVDNVSKKAVREVTDPDSEAGIQSTLSAKEKIAEEKENEEEKKQALFEGIEAYRVSTKVISDQSIALRIKPLLVQMYQSFDRLEKKYKELTYGETALGFIDKKTCK